MSAKNTSAHKVPLVVTALAFAAIIYIVAPVVALAGKVPWRHMGELLRNEDTASLLKVSFFSSVEATLLTVVLGVPLALWLQTLRKGAVVARGLVLLPLALPPVVGGMALSAALGRNGFAAPLLDALGFNLAFAFPGVVAAHTFICLPFVVVTVDAALRQLDEEIIASARSVGMSTFAVLRHIILPAVMPAIATGTGLAIARSLGEFGTTLTFAGSMPGQTRTMPLGIYLARETNPDAAYALSALLVGIAILCLALASLPALLRKQHSPRPHKQSTLDCAALATLTTPKDDPKPLTLTHQGERFTFPASAITAVIGPNGAGKTTMMKHIAGRISSPDFLIDSSTKESVVLLTQSPGLPPTATVHKAITMASRDEKRTDLLLDAAGLTELAEIPVPALSGGQAAQVALVRALAVRPRILLLDEPLAAMDVDSAAQWRMFLQETRKDRTTVLVTHNVGDVTVLADNVTTMEAGRVKSSQSLHQFTQAPPTDFSKHLLGMNVLSGTVLSSPVGSEQVSVQLTGTQYRVTGEVMSPDLARGQEVRVSFPASAVVINGHGGQLNTDVLTGKISAFEASGGGLLAAQLTVNDSVTLTVLLPPHILLGFSLTIGSKIECTLIPELVRVERI